MLATLKIKNVALISEKTVEFGKGLNIISGETGSGKSIILDSLALCFGERGDKTHIREGEKSLRVQALFTLIDESICNKVKSEMGIDCGEEIILEREYDISGKSVARINGELVTASMLKNVSAMLVDIHGQHEHQSIMSREFQLKIVDKYIGAPAAALLTKINSLIDKINANKDVIKTLGGSPDQQKYLLELYTFQATEIQSACVEAGEFERLLDTRKRMDSFEKINSALAQCRAYLSSGEYGASATEQLHGAFKNLDNIKSCGDEYLALTTRLESALIEIKDIGETTGELLEDANFDQREYERIDDRIEKIKKLFKKYGGDYAGICKYEQDLQQKIAVLTTSDETYSELTLENERLVKEITTQEILLTRERIRAADELCKKIREEIVSLGLPNAQIVAKMDRITADYSRSGADEIDILFSANIGFEPRSLTKIISGGELSRFMLAYKNVIAKLDNIGTMIFDEIDAGISGVIGQRVAESLNSLSKLKQVIAITHLPTIASFADTHLFVSKSSNLDTTVTDIYPLNYDQSVYELARMLGAVGEESALELARKMKKAESI